METPSQSQDIFKFPRLANTLNEIKKLVAIEPDKCTLWIGAGYSRFVSSAPTWTDFLSKCIAKIADSETRVHAEKLMAKGLLRLTAEYLDEVLQEDMLSMIASQFGKLPTNQSLPVGRFCAKRIITTNYDNLLERAVPWYQVTYPTGKVEKLLQSRFQILKLHGSISEPDSCVLSSSAYARTYNDHFSWFLIHVLTNSSVLFIGTSFDKSEPFYKFLKLIKNLGYRMPNHYALISVNSNAKGKELGEELFENLGVRVIPYIPDTKFRNFNELIELMLDWRWSDYFDPSDCKKEFDKLVKKIKTLNDEKTNYIDVNNALFECSLLILRWVNQQIPITEQLSFSDTALSLVREVVNRPNSASYFNRLSKSGIDLTNIISSTARLENPSKPALDGFIVALEKLEAAGRTSVASDHNMVRNKRIKLYGNKNIPFFNGKNRWSDLDK